MIDIEHGALCAFEEDALAFALRVVEHIPDGRDERKNARGDFLQRLDDGAGLKLLETVPAAQRIMMRKKALDLDRERRRVGKVDHTDGAAAGLVFIGRPDAALCRADLHARIGAFAHLVEFAMDGQDQDCIFRDLEVLRRDLHALGRDLVHFLGEGPGIEHDAIPQNGELAGPHDARWQQRELVGDAIDDERMACIVTTLEAHHDVGSLRQPVHDLALALVSPLGADYCNICHFIQCLRK